MSFLAPLGFLFAAALPVIVFFYLLKLRRVRREVSSNLLWKRAAEDLHANAPFQKLRKNLLLLLQLIIAALLVLGLARPFMNLRAQNAAHTVLLIDQSASMGAKDEQGGKTRLEAAKHNAISRIRNMAPGESAMVISFADKPAVLAQFTSDKKRLEAALGSIEQTDLGTQPGDALSLAQSLARPVKADIVIYSDGAFPATPLQVTQNTKCQFVKLGTRGENVGVVALDLRRPPENPKTFQVFATVRNYTAKSVSTRLEVLNGGKLIDAKAIELKPKAEASQIFTNAQVTEGRVELRLTSQDDLPADNAAFAVVKPPRKKRLILVSAGNYFLERVLAQDAAHQFEIVKVLPSQFSPDNSKGDLYIFDGQVPVQTLAEGNYLIINARPPLDGFVETGFEDNPVIFDWNQQHQVMRYVELGDVQIRRARKLTLPPATQVLAESRETPLVVAYSAANRNVVLWNFDLFESNLPLRIAFPILASNSVDWLLRTGTPGESSTMGTGQVIQMEVPASLRRASMRDPGGRNWSLVPNANHRLLFDRTSRAGFYLAEINGKPTEEFGVSVANLRESDIEPRETLPLQGGGAIQSSGVDLRVNREVWKWFALAALVVLLLEWLIYHRRIWV